MTNQKALETLQKGMECMDHPCDYEAGHEGCVGCWFLTVFHDAIKTAIEALEFCIEVDDDGH